MKNAQRLALATALLTLVLIALGAYVRATRSGLGCPDWPTCHGGVIPPANRHSIIEYLHRFVASTVGLLVIATAVLAWKRYRESSFIVWTSIVAVPLVGIQGLLGAITVYRELPPEIVATHLVIAMVVLGFELAVYIAMYLEDPDHRGRAAQIARASQQPGQFAVATVAWLAVVTWIGGYLPEYGANTACTGWPLCDGTAVPLHDSQQVWHMIHRYVAGALVFFVVPFIIVAWRRRREIFWAGPIAIACAVLYFLQVFVGALNVWYTFPAWLTVSHTAIAAGIWFVLSAAVLLTYYVPSTARVSKLVPRAGVTA